MTTDRALPLRTRGYQGSKFALTTGTCDASICNKQPPWVVELSVAMPGRD